MIIFLITYPNTIINEAKIINELFNEGLAVLHLRKPNYTIEETERLVNAIDEKYHSKIAMHQHHSIAEKYGINRMHFSESNRLTATEQELKKLKEKKNILSTSIHSINDLELLSDNFTYTFLGPVFESVSKPGYKALTEEIKIIKNKSRATKVIAIGGITTEKIESIKQANFDGAALLGVIWKDTTNAIEVFKACQKSAIM